MFFLSAFKFTTNNVIGRIFVFMVLLTKKLCMSMKTFRTKPNGNILTIKILIEILKVLIKEKRSPLDTAIKLNDFELVKYFIEINPENVNAIITEAGSTPLHRSVWCGNEDIVKFLLENGANVNA